MANDNIVGDLEVVSVTMEMLKLNEMHCVF